MSYQVPNYETQIESQKTLNNGALTVTFRHIVAKI